MGLNKCKCSPNQRNKQAYQTDNVTKRQISLINCDFKHIIIMRTKVGIKTNPNRPPMADDL